MSLSRFLICYEKVSKQDIIDIMFSLDCTVIKNDDSSWNIYNKDGATIWFYIEDTKLILEMTEPEEYEIWNTYLRGAPKTFFNIGISRCAGSIALSYILIKKIMQKWSTIIDDDGDIFTIKDIDQLLLSAQEAGL